MTNANVEYLIHYFNIESKAGSDLGWPEYSAKCAEYANFLQRTRDLEQLVTMFKATDFENKNIFFETLEQDAERPDLAELLGYEAFYNEHYA
jgi:hypothetical protein